MFGSIVVGTDGSDTASQAVRQAVDLAHAVRAKHELGLEDPEALASQSASWPPTQRSRWRWARGRRYVEQHPSRCVMVDRLELDASRRRNGGTARSVAPSGRTALIAGRWHTR